MGPPQKLVWDPGASFRDNTICVYQRIAKCNVKLPRSFREIIIGQLIM